MTDKEKVLAVWPDAREVQLRRGKWLIAHGNDHDRLGYSILGPEFTSTEAAWQNAAESLPAAPDQETDEKDDAWKSMVESILPEPVAPVEAKEKCELCQNDDHSKHDISIYRLGCQNAGCNCDAEPKPAPSATEYLDAEGKPFPPACEYCGQWMFRQEVRKEYAKNKSQPDSSSIPDEIEQYITRRAGSYHCNICGYAVANGFPLTHGKIAGGVICPVAILSRPRDSSSISTAKLICKHCHKTIFADISYTHDDGDMFCDDGETCAAPTISTEFGFTVDELVGELHQCLHTIEFLYGCLESPNFRHEYPEQTRSRIEFLQKMLPNRGGCIHSHRKADCEWCIEGDRLRSLHQSVVEKIAAWNAAKGQR